MEQDRPLRHHQLDTDDSERRWPPSDNVVANNLYEINQHENFTLHTHPFAFSLAAVDQWGFHAQNASSSCPPKQPFAFGGPSTYRSVPTAPPKRKAPAAPVPEGSRHYQRPRHAERRRHKRSASSTSTSTCSSSSELLSAEEDKRMPNFPSSGISPTSRAREQRPPRRPRVTIDHTAFPHIMTSIIAASSREALGKLYNTSHDMRARVRPLLGDHVVLSLRDCHKPVVDLQAYRCPTGPWFSWSGWEDPKPVIVNCTATDPLHIQQAGGSGLAEQSTFGDVLAQSEARLSSSVRIVLDQASIIDLVGLLRLPPRQPTIAKPDVLRIHMHQSLRTDEYHRVDSPGWDEHTLNRFSARRVVILSRFVDYWSTDTNSSELAVAPTCPVNEGTERLVIRIAYNPEDHRLSRSSIRVPTMYRPGLPKSVKEIVIILVPDEGDIDLECPGSPELVPISRALATPHIPRLGMLDSTADWVAGYLPRGVKFIFVGVETLPSEALNLSASPPAEDPSIALGGAIRKAIVKQRRLTNEAAIDNAMKNLELVDLGAYRRQVGDRQFALEIEE